MRNLALIALGIALAASESFLDKLLPFEELTPDLVLPLVLCMGLLRYNPARGAAIAFVVGYFVDTLRPGSPICLNMFVLVSLFLLSRALMTRLLMAGAVFQIVLALAGSFASSLIILSVRAIFERRIGAIEPLFILVSTRAAATAVAAPFVFALVKRVDARRMRRREEHALK